jgi:hypothetical protein
MSQIPDELREISSGKMRAMEQRSLFGARAERFLSAQADHFTGVKWKEKASACSVRNDGGGWCVGGKGVGLPQSIPGNGPGCSGYR